MSWIKLLVFLAISHFAQAFNEIQFPQFNDPIRFHHSDDSSPLNKSSITPKITHYDTRKDASSEGLQEFTPIRDTILQSQVNYYSFSVNSSSGLGEYYELLIFLSGNICTQPDNIEVNETSLAVYYSFNSTMFQNNEVGEMELFENGYFQALADLPIEPTSSTTTTSSGTGAGGAGGAGGATTPAVANANDEKILYIAVRAPQNTNVTASWTYQIGVSQNDLVFQWDDRSFGSVVDTDDNSALIVTNNLTVYDGDSDSLNTSDSKYSLYIYSYEDKDYFAGMNNSWCAVRNGPALMGPWNIENSYTTRNGGLQQQFMIQGLNESTKYVAYIVADFEGTDFGGAVYHPFEFETMTNTACELIYDLSFCDRVAYSVPAPGDPEYNDDKSTIKELYDDYVKGLYTNFSKALQQVPCDTVPEAIYSNLRTCEDCAESYKNWLCAVSIPRCNTKNVTKGYVLRNSTNQRNDFIKHTINPSQDYYEVLPCVNVCHAIVRDCPSDFGFMCPTKNESVSLSYYWDTFDNEQWPSCNYVGKFASQSSNAVKLLANWVLMVMVLSLHWL